MIRWELFAVFAVSLGASGLNALLNLIGSLLARQSLSSQQALIVGPLATNDWLDLALQLAGVAEALAPRETAKTANSSQRIIRSDGKRRLVPSLSAT